MPQHRLAFPLKARRPRGAGPRHAGAPTVRTLLIIVLALLAFALFFLWRVGQQGPVSLQVLNQSSQPVSLRFHGDGLRRDATIESLLPHEQVRVELQLAPGGSLHLASETPRARIDSLLLEQAHQLRKEHVRLEVRPGNRFVLVPVAADGSAR
jgi:hypothetical protein